MSEFGVPDALCQRWEQQHSDHYRCASIMKCFQKSRGCLMPLRLMDGSRPLVLVLVRVSRPCPWFVPCTSSCQIALLPLLTFGIKSLQTAFASRVGTWVGRVWPQQLARQGVAEREAGSAAERIHSSNSSFERPASASPGPPCLSLFTNGS